MNTYYVTIKIQAGAYEKNSASLVYAENEGAAYDIALRGECHSDEENLEWTDRGVYDLGGEFFYSAYTCELIAPEDVPVMMKYMLRFGDEELT